MKPLLTIDPGANGGICLQTATGEIDCYKIPASLTDKAALLTVLRLHEPEELKAICEDVGFHQEGNAAQGSVKLARHVGQLEMGLMMLDIPVRYARSQEWMQAFPDRPKNLNKAEKEALKVQHPGDLAKQLAKRIEKVNTQRKKDRKAYIKAKVQEAFPDVSLYPNPTKPPRRYETYPDWSGDALGILFWARKELE